MSAGAAPAAARRIALLLEYDGTAYCGSQHQENGASVQDALEGAVLALTGEAARVSFAGRTDAGVHALGQVAAFDTRGSLDTAAFVSGLNHFLAEDIAVKAAAEAREGFDPRRHAVSRLYRYRIDNRAVRSPLLRNRTWHVPRPLDLEAMQRTARRLEGTHDFAAFAGAYDGSTVRTLRRCEVRDDGCGAVTVEMEAQAFLPHQVRRTVGPLVDVGLGRAHEDDVVALLDAAQPSSAMQSAPACGLYLVRVEYDGFGFEPMRGDETGR